MKKPASILDTLSDEEMASVVRRIIYLRTEKENLSQKQFAEKLQISQSYISQLESRKKPLTKSAYEKIIAYFCVLPEWLLYGNTSNDSIYADRDEKSLIANDFIVWYGSLLVEEQAALARAIKDIYRIIKDYPPGSGTS